MRLSTRIRSSIMRTLTSDTLLNVRRGLPALRRRLSGGQPQLHYFHQVDDPYSHMMVQRLDVLEARYRVQVHRHLVSGPEAAFQGSPGQFSAWGVRDARSVADDYGVSLPGGTYIPAADAVVAAQNELAQLLDSPTFASRATELGDALWRGESAAANQTLENGARRRLSEGNRLRQRLGHYLGAMLHFEGEWYWGLDRLYHLERRLRDMQLDTRSADAPCVPRPAGISATGARASAVTLEYFPSLRSPYTAISYARTMDLVDRSGVTLRLRPVMPMMMRGVPAPRAKQLYIITDTKREADALGVPFGRIVDPFGDPVRRAFSLFPAIERLGKGRDYLGSYLSAAFAEGVDITTDEGLARVVERVGIPWPSCREALGSNEYEGVLEDNRQALEDAGLWGVPSFRVSGGTEESDFGCWGQDRLWRVESEIARRAGQV